VGITKKQ